MGTVLSIGLDVGSTTIKIVAINPHGEIVYKDYRRHYADISFALPVVFEKFKEHFDGETIRFSITGSAGMGIAERCGVSFVQEVVASSNVIMRNFPGIRTFIDIGGEDAKMIFFNDGKSPDMRMNGNCAGGTGSFIDQIASILAVEVDELSNLAESAQIIYPIASRCGVFAKTDVQNLLSRNVSKNDIAASVFHALSIQIVTSLARGYNVEPAVFICGGPFTYIPSLRKAFSNVIKLQEKELFLSEHAEVIPAWGAAMHACEQTMDYAIPEILDLFRKSYSTTAQRHSIRLKPLFNNQKEFIEWQESKKRYKLPKAGIHEIEEGPCYLGVDSGSTTTKIVALDAKGRIFFHLYEKNQGNSLLTVAKGLRKLFLKTLRANKSLAIVGSCVTGYGEDLIRNAFNLHAGMVETIAHYTAALSFNPNVSFILDIGGQDMKAVFIKNKTIVRLEINEACSSGCGSFIETFAHSLNHSVSTFAELACTSNHPCDLGTRCTVFMNSKVKQSLREGAPIADISAGLGYSVIKNCLNKVLKLNDFSVLGDHIMVQGGTFRNQSIIRAMELNTGKDVIVTDHPELMGAYGAALYAMNNSNSRPILLKELINPEIYSNKITACKNCENQCTVTCFKFGNGKVYFTGNKCEKIFSNRGTYEKKGRNIYNEKYDLLFNRKCKSKINNISIGIPRALGIYEDYPFWHTLLTGCGYNVVLSDASTMKIYETGANTIMAENICFPAKLANGHIFNLIEKKVDRLFMPFVVHEKKEDAMAVNSFNCPIVTGYSEVIKSAINPAGNYDTPIDAPSFTFKNNNLLKKACWNYIQSLPVKTALKKNVFEEVFAKSSAEQQYYKDILVEKCNDIVRHASETGRLVILLAGRPYHADPLIQHKIADMIADFDVDVISEDVARYYKLPPHTTQSVLQWELSSRIIKAAEWAANADDNVHFVQLTSFGCGTDAFILDEVSDVLLRKNKNATFLKVDDINNIGSMRLRIRSLIESLKHNQEKSVLKEKKPVKTHPFQKKDRKRKLLVPWFGDFYSPFFPALCSLLGYDAENLPPNDQESAELGLKFSNNEVCYPATLVIGDCMKALLNGKYDRNEIAFVILQTGGQCRATNYIALLKKAMISEGFNDVPVIAIGIGGSKFNEQPGFKFRWTKIFSTLVNSFLYADCLSQMYYAAAPRELKTGTIEKIKNQYIRSGITTLLSKKPQQLIKLTAMAADDFANAIEKINIPRIGIGGEIYVKYNAFSNKNILNWLVKRGIEPVVPPFTEFLLEGFASSEARVNGNIEKRSQPRFVKNFFERKILKAVQKMEERAKAFPYYRPIGNPHHEAEVASKIINLNAQFGEGWLVPASFARFAQEGINNVVSLQPFGCIANHIVSKGIEKRTKDLYPHLNLLFLDMDSGVSEANIFNRLHFMACNAEKELTATNC
jgi:predicted CoA-substrate-specific enzyme activase